MFNCISYVRNGMRTACILSVCRKCICTLLTLILLSACRTTDKTLTLHQTETKNLFRNAQSKMDVDLTLVPITLPLSVTDSDTTHKKTPLPIRLKGTIKVKTADTVATMATNRVESTEHVKRGVSQNTSMLSIGKPILVVLCITVLILFFVKKR